MLRPAEQPCEARLGIKTWKTAPVDRPVAVHEGSCPKIRQHCVVLDQPTHGPTTQPTTQNPIGSPGPRRHRPAGMTWHAARSPGRRLHLPHGVVVIEPEAA